ncbi:hypothetical protein RFI_29911 [Reticulomyxa filosa]|uniref:Uncharacterized protein n=1 Tax=Reticulomyxa filosa TaxID=46433 RepID=X6M249_RETFI|nr:hypothetical protein RFI_29911 [Reticulomyxa filosa]|eukprot:ETO07482.1 hypothetical protein RFI_29911 [Reticulomyxa filosa]
MKITFRLLVTALSTHDDIVNSYQNLLYAYAHSQFRILIRAHADGRNRQQRIRPRMEKKKECYSFIKLPIEALDVRKCPRKVCLSSKGRRFFSSAKSIRSRETAKQDFSQINPRKLDLVAATRRKKESSLRRTKKKKVLTRAKRKKWYRNINREELERDEKKNVELVSKYVFIAIEKATTLGEHSM